MIPVWVMLLTVPVYIGMSVLSFRMGMRLQRQRSQEPICGCGHHRAFHKGVGECGWHPEGHSALTCPCQNYIGPEPMPKFLMPHMAKEVEK